MEGGLGVVTGVCLVAGSESQLRQRVENILEEKVLTGARQVVGFESELRRALVERVDPYRLADRLFSEIVEAEERGSERRENDAEGEER